jgi:hypothetical protein
MSVTVVASILTVVKVYDTDMNLRESQNLPHKHFDNFMLAKVPQMFRRALSVLAQSLLLHRSDHFSDDLARSLTGDMQALDRALHHLARLCDRWIYCQSCPISESDLNFIMSQGFRFLFLPSLREVDRCIQLFASLLSLSLSSNCLAGIPFCAELLAYDGPTPESATSPELKLKLMAVANWSMLSFDKRISMQRSSGELLTVRRSCNFRG